MPRNNRSKYMANSMIQKGFEKVNVERKEEQVNNNKARKSMFWLILGIMLVLCADGIVTFITNMLGV